MADQQIEQVDCDMHGGKGPGRTDEHEPFAFVTCDDCWRRKLEQDKDAWIPPTVRRRIGG
jgi:hypothetical protein